MVKALKIEEWEQKFGEQLRAMRLKLNLTQTVVADRAGISVTSLKNLESGSGAALKTLFKVLRVYGREDWLDTLAPPITISPIQMLQSKARVRAGHSRKSK